MLDCSRTFQSIDYLKKTIDRLAFYKMNVLRLHLTDDQGWRVEIRKHPDLTARGARFFAKSQEPESYQGFYTQTELRDLVNYADVRGITIVPGNRDAERKLGNLFQVPDPHQNKRPQESSRVAELLHLPHRKAPQCQRAQADRLERDLQGGLAPNAAVMDWIGGAAQSVHASHDVVRSPNSHCYFNYPYDSIDTRRADGFDPLAGFDETQPKHVLGSQANYWSHMDREPEMVDAQLFSRLHGLAERAWSPAAANDWADFASRTKIQLVQLDEMNVSWSRGESALMDEPVGRWVSATVGKQYKPLMWDVSGRIKRAGTREVTFDYQSGGHPRRGALSPRALVPCPVTCRLWQAQPASSTRVISCRSANAATAATTPTS